MTRTSTKTITLPYLKDQFMLRKDVTFLNNGSFGACPRPVFEEYQRWQRELEAQPVDFIGRKLGKLLQETRQVVGDFINAGRDDLVFVTNATTGVNIVARSLDLQPGDEVLTSDHEYGAINKTWSFNCRKAGAKLVVQPLPVPVEDPEEWVEAFWAGVTDKTRVIALSHITSPTALILPLEAICRRAREAGIITVIDGAHAPGQIDLDMQALDVDYYAGNLHKWLLGAKGCAFLYARPERQEVLEPLIVSWGWEAGNEDSTRFLDNLERTGTSDPASFLAASAAIRFWRENDWPAVRDACHELVCEFRGQMQEMTGLQPLTPDSRAWFSQMSSVPLPEGVDTGAMRTRLWDEYKIEIPVLQWNEMPGIRISIQAFNGPEDVERLMSALKVLM